MVNTKPRSLYPRKETWCSLHSRMGGPHGRPEQVWKISPPLGFDTRTVQLAGNRFTDWAIPANILGCRMDLSEAGQTIGRLANKFHCKWPNYCQLLKSLLNTQLLQSQRTPHALQLHLCHNCTKRKIIWTASASLTIWATFQNWFWQISRA